HRGRGGGHRHRLGRQLRPRRGPLAAAPHRAVGGGDRPRVPARRRGDLRLYERPDHRRGDRLMSTGSFTPREVVGELDRYIVGQNKAKRAVAVALRNRWRRQQVGPELRDEISPKNIIMVGPTGVGKTEIARRLAKLAK